MQSTQDVVLDIPLTGVQVAALIRRTTKTVERYANQGRLKHVTAPNGTRRYLIRDVVAFLDENGAAQ